MLLGQQPCQEGERSVNLRFEEVRIRIVTVLEAVVYPPFNHLLLLLAREYFIEDF
jgi:hypothetical protein